MKNIFTAALLGVSLTLAGCDDGTSGGPGASNPPSEQKALGQSDNTFSLNTPMMATKLAQGETAIVSIGINRGDNFSEDVSLKLTGLPDGLTLDPASPLITNSDKEAAFTLKAADDAALGDFTVVITGHPTNGADAVAEMKVSVEPLDPEKVAEDAADAAQERWNEYTVAMQQQWDQYSDQYSALKDRADDAEGETKTSLEAKVSDAKMKLDAAASKLGDLKSASVDRREALKEEMGVAFAELKKAFA